MKAKGEFIAQLRHIETDPDCDVMTDFVFGIPWCDIPEEVHRCQSGQPMVKVTIKVLTEKEYEKERFKELKKEKA